MCKTFRPYSYCTGFVLIVHKMVLDIISAVKDLHLPKDNYFMCRGYGSFCKRYLHKIITSCAQRFCFAGDNYLLHERNKILFGDFFGALYTSEVLKLYLIAKHSVSASLSVSLDLLLCDTLSVINLHLLPLLHPLLFLSSSLPSLLVWPDANLRLFPTR